MTELPRKPHSESVETAFAAQDHDEASDSIDELRSFVSEPLLQSHSGIFPAGAVTEQPELNERGEYSDPYIPDRYLREYARIAALGPLRESESSIADRLYSKQDGVEFTPDLGWYCALFTGFTNDVQQRLTSSSGGITTALLMELLQRGKIDGVIHMASSTSGGVMFEYRISRTIEEIGAGAKTKYYPGSLYKSLQEIREVPGRYAVVGIPAFISEIRRMESYEAVLAERIVYHFGLICGHQKSANYAKSLAWQSDIDPKKLITIDFRVKNPNRPANDYSTRFTYRNAEGDRIDKVVPQTQLYGSNWGWSMFKTYFSDVTGDALNETADIVLGDAWLPEFTQDYRGTNVVVVRSAELLRILIEMRNSNLITLEPSTSDQVLRSQAGLVRHMRHELGYRLTWLSENGYPIPSPSEESSLVTGISRTRRAIQRARVRIAIQSHSAFLSALQADSYDVFRRDMRSFVWRYKLDDGFQRWSRRAVQLVESVKGKGMPSAKAENVCAK